MTLPEGRAAFEGILEERHQLAETLGTLLGAALQ